MNDAKLRKPKNRDIIGFFLFFSITLLLSFRPMYAVDTFWHLAIGRFIELANIPSTDLFSAVHPDSAWTQFQWLWEWLAFLAVDHGGLELLRMINALLLSGMVAGSYLIFRKHLSWGSAALVTAAFLLLTVDRFRVRPDAVNMVLFVAGLPYLLWGWRQWGRIRLLFPAVLAALWSNLHGGGVLLWVVCCGTIWAEVAYRHFRKESTERTLLEISLVMASMLLACLASPTMLSGLGHFAAIYSDAVTQIPNPEWNATWTMLLEGSHPHFWLLALTPYVVALTGGWALYKRHKEGKELPPLQLILLAVGTLYISHHWVRTAFLAVPAIYLIVRYARISSGAAASIAAIIVLTPMHHQVFSARGGLDKVMEMVEYDLEPTLYPELAADFMEKASLEGKVLNEGKWGGYLIWRTWPQNYYFFDTRHNLTDEMWPLLRRSLQLQTRSQAMNEGFDKFELELAVFKNGGEPFDRAPEGWTLLFKAGPEVIYQRNDGPNARGNLKRAERVWRRTGSPISYGGERWLQMPWRSQQIKQANESQSGLHLNAKRLYRAGFYKEALETWNAMAAAEQNPRHLTFWRAAAYLALGEKAEAQKILAGHPNEPGIPLLLARDLSVLQNP